MRKIKIPDTHLFWAIESSVWGLLPYSIREKRFNAWRSVAINEKQWRAFRRKGVYKLIRISVAVSKV